MVRYWIQLSLIEKSFLSLEVVLKIFGRVMQVGLQELAFDCITHLFDYWNPPRILVPSMRFCVICAIPYGPLPITDNPIIPADGAPPNDTLTFCVDT